MTIVAESDLLPMMMDHVPDAIYFKDLQSRFIRISRSLALRFGLSDPAEAIGKSDFDFFTEEHARQAYSDEQEVIRTGRPLVAREEPEYWPDGRVTWASTTKLPLRDRNGVIIGTFGISRDVTHRKQMEDSLRQAKDLAESSQRRSRLIVDSAYDAYVAMDAEGRIVDWNRQAELTFGWPREQAIDRLLHELIIPEPFRAAHLTGVRHFLATGEGPLLNRRIEVHALRRDGSEFPVEMTIVPIRDGPEWLFSAFLHDITERKRAEDELRKARDAAEAASHAKSEFLANMSHEIRTPLHGIIGMTELLLDTSLGAEQRDYLETVKKSADTLMSVINDILDFSKIEAGKLELDHSPFDLRDSLGDMLNTLAVRAHQKGLELACHIAPEVPESVIGDAVRLQQILINLVGNAIKFTERGEVVVDVQMQNGSSRVVLEDSAHPTTTILHFTVRDTGIGIPIDKQRLIFEAFAQVDGSTTRRYGGTGLGLAISSRLVQRMGGCLWVESVPGQGSTFHFTVRFGRHNGTLERALGPEPGRMRGLSVLVVDDNATNRFILAETLTQWQMRPVPVPDGASALLALEQAHQSGEPFALVLLDAHMPEMDGFMLAERIRDHPDLAGATVMMLSSACQPLDARRCQELGLAAYLTKPIKQAELYRAILAALGSPVACPAPRAAPPPVPPTRALRLLLAEDNPVNQKLAVRLLEKQGHSLVVVSNGREAAEVVQRQPFDLVLMDVQMPEMDGLEAAAAIRERERGTGRHVPILAMTAYAMKGDRERCLEAGMDGYVSKPIHPRELWEAIDKLTPSNAQAAGEESAIVNRAALRQRLGDDPQLLRELIEVFLADCPRLWQNVRDALAQSDAVKLKRAAHTLKGSVGAFGAEAAWEAAERLERLAGQSDLSRAAEVAADLERELERLKTCLRELGSAQERNLFANKEAYEDTNDA